MVILRTSLATLVLVAMAGLAYGQQKGDCGGKGKEECPRGCGLKTCCGEKGCCTKECGTETYMKNCYKSVCTTVCLPTRPCCPLRDPSCGCDKGKGCCDPKGNCGRKGCCDRCSGKSKDKDKGPICCTKGGPLCHLANKHGKGCGKGCGKDCGKDNGKGCCDPKGACDSCDKDGKGCSGGLCGLWGGLADCCSCKPRVKKHLMVREVVACEKAVMKCPVAKDPGCGKGDAKAGGRVEGETEAAPDVPEPPPVRVGRTGTTIVPASYTSSSLFGSLFK